MLQVHFCVNLLVIWLFNIFTDTKSYIGDSEVKKHFNI